MPASGDPVGFKAVTRRGKVSERAAEKLDDLLDLALLQNNRFIREFLRSKRVPMGTTKQEFENRLRTAVGSRIVTLEDIREWLAGVEGWGNQHVFPFEVPNNDRDAPPTREEFRIRLTAARLVRFLDAPIPQNPSENLALATIRHSAAGVSFLWVRGSPALIRRKDLDREEEIDGDDIEFHAFERRWSRVAARFEWRGSAKLAAVFLARRDESDYMQQRDRLLEMVTKVLPSVANWTPLDIPRVVTRLDQAGLKAPAAGGRREVRVNSTVFQGASANIRLSANSEQDGYQDDADVREVRLAVDTTKFVGGSGDCYVSPSDDQGEFHVRLYGNEKRLLLWEKMTASQVWSLLIYLRSQV